MKIDTMKKNGGDRRYKTHHVGTSEVSLCLPSAASSTCQNNSAGNAYTGQRLRGDSEGAIELCMMYYIIRA